MNTQTLFTQALEAALSKKDHTLIDDRNWANTGTFRAVPTGSLSHTIAVHYSFQSGYATLRAEDSSGTLLRDFPYVRHNELQTALDQILGLLPKKKPGKRA